MLLLSPKTRSPYSCSGSRPTAHEGHRHTGLQGLWNSGGRGGGPGGLWQAGDACPAKGATATCCSLGVQSPTARSPHFRRKVRELDFYAKPSKFYMFTGCSFPPPPFFFFPKYHVDQKSCLRALSLPSLGCRRRKGLAHESVRWGLSKQRRSLSAGVAPEGGGGSQARSDVPKRW